MKDPRRRHRRLHLLQDIRLIALCAVIAGAPDGQEIETLGRKRRAGLRRFLRLPHGIPSHHPFARVFDRLDPPAFQACFRQGLAAVSAAVPIQHVARDGKTRRGSGAAKRGPRHRVSAGATAPRLTLGQGAVDEKSTDMTALPALLELLQRHGAWVTIDARGCQKEIAHKMRQRGGHSVLTVTDHQPQLWEDIPRTFERAFDSGFAGLEHATDTTAERGHGRHERRWYPVRQSSDGLRQRDDGAGVTPIGICTSERTVHGVTTEQTR